MARLILLSACLAVAGAVTAQIPSPGSQFGPIVKWSTVNQGDSSGIKTAEWRVISSDVEWFRHFRRMYPEAVSERDIPRVADFSKEMLVAIHLGPKPTPGHGVYVETIERVRTGFWNIAAVIQEPPRGVFLPARMTYPWVVIRVERTVGTPTISWRTVTKSGIISRPDDGWCGRPGPSGEVPIWRMGSGGRLIPMNDAARRALGQPTAEEPKKNQGGDKKGSGGGS